METDGGVPTLAPHCSSLSVLIFFFNLGQKYSVLSKLPSSIELVLMTNIFHYKVMLRNNSSRLWGWQQGCPISSAQFCHIIPGFSLPLHPSPQVCESSSLTPISLLQALLCFGSCFSFPPLPNLSFHLILQKFFHWVFCHVFSCLHCSVPNSNHCFPTDSELPNSSSLKTL